MVPTNLQKTCASITAERQLRPRGERGDGSRSSFPRRPSEPFPFPAGCYKITTVFSHAQTVVLCVGCSTVLCQPTGGKARLTEGCSFRRKQH
ncbi:PREDICTED: 40S ribosomal protein S27-like [Aptenodytes forsteri]|uniref:40S ribosomal protein S27-like n=1 Tax=Aptenodytes forsteri TaxID=9233 RepID=UPI00090493E6|nr:PREDICTED: 40S ribosomal protein S27-like [Aptenodytes forsteri]